MRQYSCTHPNPQFMVMAKTSTFGIFRGRNVLGRNVHGRNGLHWNHRQNNTTVILSKLWDISTVFCNHPKILPQMMQTEKQTALILIRLFLIRPALFAEKNCKVTAAASCGSVMINYLNN